MRIMIIIPLLIIKKILTDLTDNEEWASHFSRIISLVINGIVLGSNIDNESLFNILKSCITNLLYSDFDLYRKIRSSIRLR